ncbi:hypothetical protein DM02DRAFT_30481 [Periconia macrospinosa]|uniref:Uncharacterized protein n=1 Tax=Periconia macrospinosa TaxID=97972 RepID=A0A2V1DKS2_9PLEO|nr:hypothetical protein DM02DRAFT_30481 [Periconia macrospinosa]
MVGLEPLKNTATAQWGRSLTHSDYSKILKGFGPQDMDDRWGIQTDTPDAQGNTVAYLYRSWGSVVQFSLTITAGDADNTETKDWAKIVTISWNEQPGYQKVTEEEAKESSVNLCRGLLRCEMKD